MMVDCVDHIVEVVKKSSTAGLNKAQCYENGKGFQYLDLNSVLGIFFKKIPDAYIYTYVNLLHHAMNLSEVYYKNWQSRGSLLLQYAPFNPYQD